VRHSVWNNRYALLYEPEKKTFGWWRHLRNACIDRCRWERVPSWYGRKTIGEYLQQANVVSSQKSPCTNNWCRANGIPLYVARGLGYVEDMVEAVLELEEVNPLFTSVSDIPCIAPDIIGRIFALYAESGKDACSVWVPENLCREYGCRTAYVEQVCGVNAVPAGINILRGDCRGTG
jgi:GTP:adenosylcobinamide-phosphate guanylyltransferase